MQINIILFYIVLEFAFFKEVSKEYLQRGYIFSEVEVLINTICSVLYVYAYKISEVGMSKQILFSLYLALFHDPH